ncbi:MAG: hypothetical protein WBA74_02080, partial [Cyclobacteriaceae bacterium]
MNIRKITGILIGICLVWQTGIAQNYTIIHVKGDMKLADGTSLKRGTRLSEESQIIFGSDNAAAAAISSSRGRFIIKKGGNAENKNDTFYLLKAVLSPVKGRMSTRSGKLNNLIALKKFFGEEPLAFLGDKEYVAVSEEAFPQGYQHFFFLRYQYKGEAVNKKLLSDKQTMIWDKNDIFSVDGEKILPEETSDHTLYYLGEGGKPVLVSTVNFTFVPETDVNTIISEIQTDANFNEEEKIKLAVDLFTELY